MLKELEDYNWFPNMLRKFQLEFIGSLVNWFGFYKPIVPLAKNLLENAKTNAVIDLCSGSGEPAIYLQKKIANNFVTTLTDKFPQKKSSTSSLSYLQQSIDVLNIMPEKEKLYTMYNAFHHFDDEQQRNILQKFSTNQSSILIVEILTPSFFTFLNVIFSGTIGQLLLTPFVKPFSFWRLFFTYVIPINIFTVVYDGIISVIKSKSVKQYQALVSTITQNNYSIEVLCFNQWQGKLICIKANPIYAQ
jgi:ubiquinone/menaquinone biosynthesis C-methylase UbiE